uniref:Uncharacterized protein n=1 Tax=Fagus sylvatica TaxID=28930 RepID=A0A2N9F4Y3_FAGSY
MAQWLGSRLSDSRLLDLEMVLARDLSSVARWFGSISAHDRIKKADVILVSGAGQNRDGSQIRVMGTLLVTRRVRVRVTADGCEIFWASRSDDAEQYDGVIFLNQCQNRRRKIVDRKCGGSGGAVKRSQIFRSYRPRVGTRAGLDSDRVTGICDQFSEKERFVVRNWVLLGIWGLELKIFLWGFGISKAFGSFGWQTHLRLIKKCLIRSTDTWQHQRKPKQLGLRSSAEELGLEAQIGYFLGLDLGGASHT